MSLHNCEGPANDGSFAVEGYLTGPLSSGPLARCAAAQTRPGKMQPRGIQEHRQYRRQP